MKFSIIMVNLNSGDKLNKTIESVENQSYSGYEILIKDAGSIDDSLKSIKGRSQSILRTKDKIVDKVQDNNSKRQEIQEDRAIRLLVTKDAGIYDGMNQAIQEARGDYVLFLNCGDAFYNDKVLQTAADYLDGCGRNHRILYGDTYCESSRAMVAMPSIITEFTCYRNIPCHQSCFYSRELFCEHPYQLEYKIRADYEHFLWCFYKAQAKPIHMGITVSSYEGGGYSEDKANLERDKREHREILLKYIPKMQILKYQIIMFLSLVGFRKWIAEKSIFAGIYNKFKKFYYERKK